MSDTYRFTNKKTPMSSWGHAMFAEDPYSVAHYGKNAYYFDSSQAVDIYDLRDDIIDQWDEDMEDGYFPKYLDGISGEVIFPEFAPEDIVNSAEAWDNEEMLQWIYHTILEPRDIMAVRLPDGAVVFDESLIQYIGDNSEYL